MELRPWSFALGLLLIALPAFSQTRPYIGFVYPAGGERGATVQIRLGGQGLDDVHSALVTGAGVSARVVECCRRLNNQEIQLLNEQLKELKGATSAVASAQGRNAPPPVMEKSARKRAARIETRVAEFVPTPACASIATLAIVEVEIAPDAEPGRREIRLVTWRGVSNPLAFHVGQVPEHTRKPMLSATLQVLGKEARALRQRPADQAEVRIAIPCTVNGQIASGEVNRYRFEARKGQRLVISTLGRQLVPYIADAVPGWFQPVLTVLDTSGKELAFADDYHFKPDPVILWEVPKDGEYVFAITDALFRGREDFVYRATIGELPFVTGIFPPGRSAGTTVAPRLTGWNLRGAELAALPADAAPGIHLLTACRKGFVSSPVPFAVDTLPETVEREPNDACASAQELALPLIVNGHIDAANDVDVFRFSARSNDVVVAEALARRLDSPLDSVIRLTDATGRVLAFNDDREDLGAGLNTHHADSWLMVRLPADGDYYVHLGDISRHGGEEFVYRLRLSAPRPDFELRVAPSAVRIRTNVSAPVTVYAQREDGFAGSIKLELKDPAEGFSAAPVKLAAGQNNATLTVKGPSSPNQMPFNCSVIGRATIDGREVVHEAVPADDRMQAFLWRHLLPAENLKVLAWDPAFEPPPKRPAPVRPPALVTTNVVTATNTPGATNVTAAAKPKFSPQQIAGRLRELKRLYEDDLLTDEFYYQKVAECEAGL